MSKNGEEQPMGVDIDEVDPSEMWSLEEKDAYFNELEESPLLMTSFSEADRSSNTNFMALESIIHDNRSDMEMVEDYNHEAKKSFAKGKFFLTTAYNQFQKAAFYAERLEKNPDNLHLLATIYANCCLIQMKKENYRTCLKDCEKALAIEPRYIKVLYRKGRALFGLNDYQKAIECCNMILDDDKDNVYTLKLKTECEAKIEKNNKMNEQRARSEQRKLEEKELVMNTIKARGYHCGPSLYQYPKGYDSPILLRNDELVFPVMLLYPESNQSDFVKEMSESDTFADIFYMLYPSKNSNNDYLPWDEEKQYSVGNIEIWMEKNMVLPYPEGKEYDLEKLRNHHGKKEYIRINSNYTLGDVLSFSSYVIPEIPVFYIYARNACRRDFFSSQENKMYQLAKGNTVTRIARCQNCGKYEGDTEEYKKCGKCKQTKYCSRECQIADWKIHKHQCNATKE